MGDAAFGAAIAGVAIKPGQRHGFIFDALAAGAAAAAQLSELWGRRYLSPASRLRAMTMR